MYKTDKPRIFDFFNSNVKGKNPKMKPTVGFMSPDERPANMGKPTTPKRIYTVSVKRICFCVSKNALSASANT